MLKNSAGSAVERLIAIGLVRGEGFAVVANLIQADVCYDRCVPGSALKALDRETVSEVVRRYLDTLDVDAADRLQKKVSLTDPQSRWATKRQGAAGFSCSAN